MSRIVCNFAGQSWARCEVVYGVDDCAGNPCKNSAICVDKYDGFECVCRAGWSGVDCTTEVKVEYTIKLTTSDAEGSGTANAVFFQFTGTEGDSSGSEELVFESIGRSARDADEECPSDNDDNPGYKEYTMIAKDVGELHKVTYKVAADDSLDPAIIQVSFKGAVYVAVGDLPKSEFAKAVSVTMVKGREYELEFGTADSPDWAATANDVYVQLTGQDWQVSGAVVAFPTGMDDGVTCKTKFYAADVGEPAKITYWVRNDDSVLPSSIKVDGRYKAQVTEGKKCYGAAFPQDYDTGEGFAFEDASCKAGDGNGCSTVDGCRWCTLWDPDTAENEVLCPWVLPYSDGRFIIIDLVDSAGAYCDVTDGSAASSTYPCTCGGATCTANTMCNPATNTCTAAKCTVGDGSQRSAAYPCACGTSTCTDNQMCNAGTNKCTTAKCSVADGSAVSTTYPCECDADGSTSLTCTANQKCTDDAGTDGNDKCALVACSVVDGSAVSGAYPCECGTGVTL